MIKVEEVLSSRRNRQGKTKIEVLAVKLIKSLPPGL